MKTMKMTSLSRRSLLKNSVLGATALATTNVAAPFVHGVHAAGTLSCAFWDHWVPGANEPLKKLCQEWADKEKVDLTLDFITSQGDKLNLTIAAEALARSGHDMIRLSDNQPGAYLETLVPVDDLVTDLVARHGPLLDGSVYGGKHQGHWYGVPMGLGTISAPSCARIDLFKQFVGLDVQKMYPAGGPPDKELADHWDWNAFVDAAAKCAKGGHPFGLPLSTWSDATNMVGSVFASFGSHLVDKSGNITVNTDATRQAMEWFKKLVPHLPESVFAWDNAGNNKWLVSGKGALIQNPPSAWAVAVRDAPKVAEQLWHFPSPKGPKGRFVGTNFGFQGIWNFSSNVSAAKSLMRHLTTRDAFATLVTASRGYDIPPYAKLRDFKTWAEEGPPKGVNYNYPPRGDVVAFPAGYPAPVNIADHLWSQGTIVKLVARYTHQDHTMDQAIATTEEEIRGYTRV